jgi:hypothetical protein
VSVVKIGAVKAICSLRAYMKFLPYFLHISYILHVIQYRRFPQKYTGGCEFYENRLSKIHHLHRGINEFVSYISHSLPDLDGIWYKGSAYSSLDHVRCVKLAQERS